MSLDAENAWIAFEDQNGVANADLALRMNFAQQSPTVMPGDIDPETWRPGMRDPWDCGGPPPFPWDWRALRWDPRMFPRPIWPSFPSGWRPPLDGNLQRAADDIEAFEDGVRRIQRVVDRIGFSDGPDTRLPRWRLDNGVLVFEVLGTWIQPMPNGWLPGFGFLPDSFRHGKPPAPPPAPTPPATLVPGGPPPSAVPAAAPEPPPAAPAPTQPLPAGLT